MPRSRHQRSFSDLSAQGDAQAPLDVAQFASMAQQVTEQLTDDLLDRAAESSAVQAALEARHQQEKSDGDTAEAYAVWRRRRIVQIAAGWVLSCVFVRTLEDRGLLARNRLAGPGAMDAQRAFFAFAPQLGLREYLLAIFAELDHAQATQGMFGRAHNLCWRLAPSSVGIKALVDLFRGGTPERPHFRFGQTSTQFLSDLYEQLSEDTRKHDALVRTPGFVVSFILDRTLEPAITEFGLHETTLIDPTCGSGEFLLGAFERLYERWSALDPAGTNEAHVTRALASIYGVDIVPYAASIAGFRLMLAALAKLGVSELHDAPRLPLNVFVADSLLQSRAEGKAAQEFAFDDEVAAKAALGRRFAAVVGNPPYITVKDKALRDRYVEIYPVAYRNFALPVLFIQRFFTLAREGGFVGQITANSFMKRKFGRRVIEDFLPTVDLQLIVNTEDAFIPGHETPTVMLFGRSRAPKSEMVSAVLARKGKPSRPKEPSQGLVWSSIRGKWRDQGYEDEYITVAEIERSELGVHPWNLEGGGARELEALVTKTSDTKVGDHIDSFSFTITKQDEVFCQASHVLERWQIDPDWRRPFVTGESLRNWTLDTNIEVLFPYDTETKARELDDACLRALWRFRSVLDARVVFGRKHIHELDKRWYEYAQIPPGCAAGPRIGFAAIASHNHFVFARDGNVFTRSATAIELPASSTVEDHLALLGYLNSSVVCFLIKQVAFAKTTPDHNDVAVVDISPKVIAGLPVPNVLEHWRGQIIDAARELDALGTKFVAAGPARRMPKAAGDVETIRAALEAGEAESARLSRELVARQEDLDWLIYRALGFVDELMTEPAELEPGDRAFEIHQRIVTGQTTTMAQTRPVLAKKLAAINGSRSLRVLEGPDFKRRWLGERGQFKTYEQRFVDALVHELLTSIERGWPIAKLLTAEAASDALLADKQALLQFARERVELSLPNLFPALAVPYLAVWRFADHGFDKHRVWQQAWALQRREDAGQSLDEIPAPPKCKGRDYRNFQLWRLRGKLDVPTERFIAYPGLESDRDPRPIYGWAGWDHGQRAKALSNLYHDRRDNEGWSAARLTPILAGLLELLPWIEQWHNEPDESGERLAGTYELFLRQELRGLGITPEQLEAWRPPKT